MFININKLKQFIENRFTGRFWKQINYFLYPSTMENCQKGYSNFVQMHVTGRRTRDSPYKVYVFLLRMTCFFKCQTHPNRHEGPWFFFAGQVIFNNKIPIYGRRIKDISFWLWHILSRLKYLSFLLFSIRQRTKKLVKSLCSPKIQAARACTSVKWLSEDTFLG